MMNPAVLNLYLVLDPTLCGGAQGMIDTALRAAKNGATAVQLRAPDWHKRELVSCARALKKGLTPLGVPLFINDHVDVALACRADGVHVGQRDMTPADCRALLGPDVLLGLSVSNLDECRAVDPALVDYIGIGPIMSTSTKPDAAPAVGLNGLQAIARLSPVPNVAIGGIKAAHVADIMAHGANGIAVVSAICGQPDPAAATRHLLACLS